MALKRSDLDKYRERFDGARSARRVFTSLEVYAAYQNGVDASDLARRNDQLAAELDQLIAEEADEA